MYLPWAAHNEAAISKIAFSMLPPQSRAAVADLAKGGGLIAAMIDVLITGSDGKDKEGFSQTWAMLDSTPGCPASARCMMSRGGWREAFGNDFLPPNRKVYPFGKQVADSGPEGVLGAFKEWWEFVVQDLETGAEKFVSVTKNKKTHNPSTLPQAQRGDILKVHAAMTPYDHFGVWTWCQSQLSETVDTNFQKAWNLAKGLQQNTAEKLNVTGLLGLIEGINMLRPKEHQYKSNLCLNDLAIGDIDDRKELGWITFREGSCNEFVKAFKEWVLHEEQFESGNAYVTQVSVDWGKDILCISLIYSSALPLEILTGSGSSHSATSCWHQIAKFAHPSSFEIPTDSIQLRFTHGH